MREQSRCAFDAPDCSVRRSEGLMHGAEDLWTAAGCETNRAMGLRVLLVEGDVDLAASRAEALARGGFDPVRVADAAAAAEVMMREPIDSILCNDAARAELEKAYGNLIPVVPTAGQPNSAILKTLARLARRSMSPNTQLSLAAQLDDALANSTLALEPVLGVTDGVAWGSRATLLAPSLSQDEMTAIARELGRMRELRHVLRDRVVERLSHGAVRVIVDCDTEDLLDPGLYEPSSPLASHSASAFLCIAQHDVADVGDAAARVASLRERGFSIVLRIEADMAGLTAVWVIKPSFALVDMATFTDKKVGPVAVRVLGSVVEGCREANVDVIVDGVDTPDHVAAAREAGCVLMIGGAVTHG
jgi:EAL domain-containing protein (putative c-di-GMP-specific phosphodiesterase class I)